MPTRNNRSVTIREAYSRCYTYVVAPAAYACAVTSHSSTRGDAGEVRSEAICLDRLFYSASECSAVQLRVQLWSVNQRATEAEESPLLKFVTKKHLVKILQTAVAK
jgi:hypothetical protein